MHAIPSDVHVFKSGTELCHCSMACENILHGEEDSGEISDDFFETIDDDEIDEE